MKAVLYLMIYLILSSCSNNKKNKTSSEELASLNALEGRTGRAINNGKCSEKDVRTLPIVKLYKSVISKGEVIKGKAYFSNDYFKRLSLCNKFNYTIYLMPLGYKGEEIFDTRFSKGDTVYFSLYTDSLSGIKKGKEIGKYQLKIKLRASLSDKVSGYDTIPGGIGEAIFFVKK